MTIVDAQCFQFVVYPPCFPAVLQGPHPNLVKVVPAFRLNDPDLTKFLRFDLGA
jgi:hypothetical protein